MVQDRHVELSVNLTGAALLGAVFGYLFSGDGDRAAAPAAFFANFLQGFGSYAAAGLLAAKYKRGGAAGGLVPAAGSLLAVVCFFTPHAGYSAFDSLKDAVVAFAGMFLGWTAMSALVMALLHAAVWLVRRPDLSVDA